MLLSSLLLLTAAVGFARALTPAGEYEIKAAYLVNNGGFVHWPDEAFGDAQFQFIIRIIGDNPFGVAFEPFKKKKAAGRLLEVRSIASAAAAPEPARVAAGEIRR